MQRILVEGFSNTLTIFSKSNSTMERENAWLLLRLVNMLILTIQNHRCKFFLQLIVVVACYYVFWIGIGVFDSISADFWPILPT